MASWERRPGSRELRCESQQSISSWLCDLQPVSYPLGSCFCICKSVLAIAHSRWCFEDGEKCSTSTWHIISSLYPTRKGSGSKNPSVTLETEERSRSVALRKLGNAPNSLRHKPGSEAPAPVGKPFQNFPSLVTGTSCQRLTRP